MLFFPQMVYFVVAPLIFYKNYVVELGSHSQINYQSVALGNNCYLFWPQLKKCTLFHLSLKTPDSIKIKKSFLEETI